MSGQLVHHPVPLDLAREIVVVGKREGLHINAYIDEKMYVEELNKYTEFYSSFTKAVAHPVGDLLAFMDKPPYQTALRLRGRNCGKVVAHFEGTVQRQAEVFRSKPQYVEFTALGFPKERL